MANTTEPRVVHRPDGFFWVDHQMMVRPPGWYVFYPSTGRIPNYLGPFKTEAQAKEAAR